MENENVQTNTEVTSAPEGTGEQAAGGTPERTFTQTEVNRMMKAEKESGRKSILKELGVKDVTSAKEGLEKYQKYLESQQTDLEKATAAATQATTAQREAEARANVAEACLVAIQNGVNAEFAKDLVSIAFSKKTDEQTIEEVITSMKDNAAYSGFFKQESKSEGTGTPLGNKKLTGGTEESYGAKLAKGLKAKRRNNSNQ